MWTRKREPVKKFVLSVVAAFLITAGSAGVAGAQPSEQASTMAPMSASGQNTWY
jgi:hypothetical protein